MIGKRIGDWRVVELLSNDGGNGTVWSVDRPDGKQGALKLLNEFENPSKQNRRVLRFKSEVRQLSELAELGVTGVMPILDHGMYEDKTPWFVMPKAHSLEIPDDNVDWAITLVRGISSTVAELHKMGKTHRDIKPNNILILDSNPVLADFGLARSIDDIHTTLDSEGVGSFCFMAPECVGPSATPQFPADVYSLAKTLWVLLTKEEFPPRESLDSKEHHLSIYGIDYPRERQLMEILVAATDLRPVNRPTAQDFSDALNSLLEVPVMAEQNLRKSPARVALDLFRSMAADNKVDLRTDSIYKEFEEQIKIAFVQCYEQIAHNIGWLKKVRTGRICGVKAEQFKSDWKLRKSFCFESPPNEFQFRIRIYLFSRNLDGTPRVSILCLVAIEKFSEYQSLVEEVVSCFEGSSFTAGPKLTQLKFETMKFVGNMDNQMRVIGQLNKMMDSPSS